MACAEKDILQMVVLLKRIHIQELFSSSSNTLDFTREHGHSSLHNIYWCISSLTLKKQSLIDVSQKHKRRFYSFCNMDILTLTDNIMQVKATLLTCNITSPWEKGTTKELRRMDQYASVHGWAAYGFLPSTRKGSVDDMHRRVAKRFLCGITKGNCSYLCLSYIIVTIDCLTELWCSCHYFFKKSYKISTPWLCIMQMRFRA